MDEEPGVMERESDGAEDTNHDHRDRCVNERLGLLSVRGQQQEAVGVQRREHTT